MIELIAQGNVLDAILPLKCQYKVFRRYIMLVLGIETTCDETACAVVRDGKEILSNVISSQIDIHKEYGGVVPELACRRHVDLIIPVLNQALQEANVTLDQIDLISVANGPGLIGALLIGLNTAKALALANNKPFIGINHIEAHLYAAMMSSNTPISFPCLGVLLSGGHTALVLINEIGHYELIGQTIDDAVGEAFDKVARMLDLPYPGGPQIEKLALIGDLQKYPFKAGTVKGQPFSFSFSGLKTAVLYRLKDILKEESFNETIQRDIAASFQSIAFEDIIKKTVRAAEQYKIQTILFGGGVTNSQTLRQLFELKAPNYTCVWPSMGLSLDNAAMIAGLGYHRYLKVGTSDSLDLDPLIRIPFNSPEKP